MAPAKNNTSNAGTDSTGGFKTVAFGFDKNDVTMYIASLRKKMKSMEEEFEQKLTQALENPTASNDALKHERDVIRAEMERAWGDKLKERNSILKQQQRQINELEEKVSENEKVIEALKAQLSAATSENSDDGVMNARAAKAYVQFTSELRSISSIVQKTLQNIEMTWKGEFEEEAENSFPENSQAPDEINEILIQNQSVSNSDPVNPSQTIFNEKASKKKNRASEKAAEPQDKTSHASAQKAPEPIFFDDMEDDPLKDIIADISAESPKPAVSLNASATDETDLYQPNTKSEAANSEEGQKDVDNESAIGGYDNFSSDDDLSDLLAESGPAVYTSGASSNISEDDDLSALLAEDTIDTDKRADSDKNEDKDDISDLIAEDFSGNDFDEDFIISEEDTKTIKGDDLDAGLLSDIVINPGNEQNGDLNQMLKEKEENEFAEFGDLFIAPADEEDSIGFDIHTDTSSMEYEVSESSEKSSTQNNDKKEDDLFDFSFLAADSDDEDDMSTDASFPGML